MPKLAIVKLNESQIHAFLNSQEVLAEMKRRAQRIADAAGGAPDFEVVVGQTDRVHASAITATWAGKAAEAQGRALTRAIDAGRG